MNAAGDYLDRVPLVVIDLQLARGVIVVSALRIRSLETAILPGSRRGGTQKSRESIFMEILSYDVIGKMSLNM